MGYKKQRLGINFHPQLEVKSDTAIFMSSLEERAQLEGLLCYRCCPCMRR
jgi:hypothetical protein